MSYNVITLDGKNYIIISELNINGFDYLYVINEDLEDNSYSVLKRTIKDGMFVVESLTDDEEIEMVFEELAKEDM